MARVREVRTTSNVYASPVKTVQIPLNDDREEKAQRLHSRHLAHSRQMENIRAAATPQRKRKSLGGGPHTPSQGDDIPYDVAGSAVTPMKKVPILANFEEWMKMATDNKINATNSWNFALIDYFHDMSLLREGDSVNFQKASCTLDGCVKIYTSRVDSVATETGKLLSGLADSKSSKQKSGEYGEEGEEGEDGEEGGDGARKKSTKKAQRSAEATLVTSFDQLKLKKMELDFSVDPLFKKAAADFDEGGAKGLLMNHLSIDNTGRIVFDSSDDAPEEDIEESRRDSMEPDPTDPHIKKEFDEPLIEDAQVDIASLGARFFPDLSRLDNQDICPSMKTFELGSSDSSLDLPFLKAQDSQTQPDIDGADATAVDAKNENSPYDLDEGWDAPDGFDLGPETGFGEGGEAWARDAALHPQVRVHDAATEGEEGGEVGVFDTESNTYGVTLQHRDRDQENILNYFDTALHKNWAGPEHWRISKIKEANKPAPAQRVRKEKEPFQIDFMSPMTQELATALYTPASSNSVISLPKAQRRSKTRNLLPDDKHFNSKDLLKLFLKPKAMLRTRGSSSRGLASSPPPPPEGEIDEAYWANAQAEQGMAGDYDANFFQDDNLPLGGDNGVGDDDDAFADAQEMFAPAVDDDGAVAVPFGEGVNNVTAGAPGSLQEGTFGANLVAQSRRLRPEYVQYARVAKKVDVRRLKEEMWRETGFDDRPVPDPPSSDEKDGNQSFVTLMRKLQTAYSKSEFDNVSTSYGFIALLHLANEKSLKLEQASDLQDISVDRDRSC